MIRATPESPRLFRSDALDVFTRVPWWGVPLVYVPAIAGMGAWSVAIVGPGVALGVALAGLLAWTLLEYALHRSLFHWVPAHRWGPRFHFLVHGVHHAWVHDRYRLVMPPAVSGLLALPLFGVCRLALGAWAFPFFTGLMAGYLVYDMTHYALHHARWRGRVFTRLRAHHMNHHHAKAGRKFGVSTTLWDHVFGTY